MAVWCLLVEQMLELFVELVQMVMTVYLEDMIAMRNFASAPRDVPTR